MEKYISNINNLVIQALKNDSKMKTKAESGDASSCFQMGMLYLLGINTPIDFKKASEYLGNNSLAEAPDANRLLGFIAECEGNYSLAFKNYANAGKKNRPYINRVYEERECLQSLFKNLDLPSPVLNKEITAVLNEFIKGGGSKVDASIKLAIICNDEESCQEAAQALYDEGDYYSAMKWLQKCNIDNSHPLFAAIESCLSDSKNSFKFSETLNVIEIEGDSLLVNSNAFTSFSNIKTLCSDVSSECKEKWQKETKSIISQIVKEEKNRIKEQKDAELAEKAAEEERKKQLKEKIDTIGGLSVLLVFVIGYFFGVSVAVVTFVVIVIIIIIIEKQLGIEDSDKKKKNK